MSVEAKKKYSPFSQLSNYFASSTPMLTTFKSPRPGYVTKYAPKYTQGSYGKGRTRRRGGKPAAATMSIYRDVASVIGGFPQTQKQKLIVHLYTQQSLATVSYGEVQFDLNGIFDTNSITHSQPLGFAKYMAVYTKAFVTSAKWRVISANTGSTGTAPSEAIVAGATVTTNATSLGNINQAVATGLSQYNVIGESPDTKTTAGFISIGKFLNKPRVLDDPRLFNTVAANPLDVVVLHVWGFNPGPNTSNMGASVTIEYYVTFTDPIPFT